MRRKSSGKRQSGRKEHHKVLVLCEGETEEAYFKGLCRYFQDLQKTAPGAQARPTSPVSAVTAKRTEARLIVDEALERRSEGYSQIWAVFDTEGSDVGQERRRVRQKHYSDGEGGVDTAVSHPAFEIWLLLHHRLRGALNGCHRPDDSESLLKTVVPNWAKGARVHKKAGTCFSDFSAGLEQAREEAAKTPLDCYDDYPWTDVHRLVDSIEKQYSGDTE